MNIKESDLKGLIRYIEQIKTCITEGKNEDALYFLTALQDNIDNYIEENRTIKINDKVEITDITSDLDIYKDFLDAKGRVIAILNNRKYPYKIEFADRRLRQIASLREVCWKKEELRVI